MHVTSPRSIMVHQDFTSKEVRRVKRLNIDNTKQHHTPHRWLPAKVMYPANSTNRFSWLTCSTRIFFLGGTLSYIYISNITHYQAVLLKFKIVCLQFYTTDVMLYMLFCYLLDRNALLIEHLSFNADILFKML